MDLSGLERALELREASHRELAEKPIREHGSRSELVKEALEARESARAVLENAEDDAERVIAAIVSASRAPLAPPEAAERKRPNPRRPRPASAR